MIKYIVFWVISTTTITSCPEETYQDEFGIERDYSMKLSVACSETNIETKSLEFTNKDSAFSFYKRGLKRIKKQNNLWEFGSRITAIKIDSIQQ